jgi:tRNA G26 N,N-dimethylase Trm1
MIPMPDNLLDRATAVDCARYLSAVLRELDNGWAGSVCLTAQDIAALSGIDQSKQSAVRRGLAEAGILRAEQTPIGFRLGLGAE